MNAVDDVFSKHGVTPANETLTGRRARRSTSAASAVAATPKPFDWKTLKLGDYIQVRGNRAPTSYSEIEDGRRPHRPSHRQGRRQPADHGPVREPLGAA